MSDAQKMIVAAGKGDMEAGMGVDVSLCSHACTNRKSSSILFPVVAGSLSPSHTHHAVLQLVADSNVDPNARGESIYHGEGWTALHAAAQVCPPCG